MRLAGIKPGDIVLVDDGLPYHATVKSRESRALRVEVIGRPGVYKTIKPHYVAAHWRRSNAS